MKNAKGDSRPFLPTEPYKMTPAKVCLARAAMADQETKVADLAASSASRGRPCTGTSGRPASCAPTDRSCWTRISDRLGPHAEEFFGFTVVNFEK